ALLGLLDGVHLDELKDRLSSFLRDLFADEIAVEKSRLQEGTRLATVMWEEAPELDLDEEWTGTTHRSGTLHTRPSRIPTVVAVVALLCLGLVVAWFSSRPEPVTERVQTYVPVEAEVATHGTLRFRVSPEVEASIYVRGELAGSGVSVDLEDIEPGEDIAVRVEAEGYTPFSDTVSILAGESLRLKVQLRKKPRARVPAAPSRAVEASTAPVAPVAKAPGQISVSVRGGWAWVYIDGKKIDQTPLGNHSIAAGDHKVRVVNPESGFEDSRTVTITPGAKERVSFEVR
ncbi:MAG: PEGA domain-containing protein, partial [Myxococcota bacterium]|nr:PEGA domain-containing protein [Myxococcota bacterium]